MNYKKPTGLLLGRYQPFHDGHLALFEESINKVGQVIIMVRDTHNLDNNNPYDFEEVKKNIIKKIPQKYSGKYEIILVPNITDIFYGRDVGYNIEKITLPEHIQNISATNIRNQK